MTPRAPRPRRPRRARGAAESLASIVLGFESVIVFLAGLVVYGLRATPPGVAVWWAVVGGTVLALLMVATAGVTGRRWGIVAGWVLQALLCAAALLVPAIVVAGVLFAGMYAYATIKGAQLDRRTARFRAQNPDTPAEE